MFWFSRELFESLLSVNGARWRLLLGPWAAAHVSNSETFKAGGFYCLPILHPPAILSSPVHPSAHITLSSLAKWAVPTETLQTMQFDDVLPTVEDFQNQSSPRYREGLSLVPNKEPSQCSSGQHSSQPVARRRWAWQPRSVCRREILCTVGPPFFTAVHRLLGW